MNFFEHQEKARSKTNRLVLLFFFAVAMIVAALYAVIRYAAWFTMAQSAAKTNAPQPPFVLWDPLWFAAIAGGVVLFIGLASLFKIFQLRGGGAKVAEMMGATKVEINTSDPQKRRYLNIVEEMAIASGITMPGVYIMENEPGINAFAAGYTPQNAVVAVTRGTLDTLTRDELQGVIAHEFSHIFNGDMRMNIRLMGVMFGILAIGVIGSIIMRGTLYSGGLRSRRDNNSSGMAIMVAGLAVMAIGFIGTFVGRMIQAAVSRQREYLADSSAVQFTRNPAGIAGALKKIGGFSHGSQMMTPKAQEAGHFFFGQGPKISFMSGMLATHPPLAKRIAAIDPSFSGEYAQTKASQTAQAQSTGAAMGFSGGPAVSLGEKVYEIDPDTVPDRVGTLSEQSVEVAAAMIAAIPKDLKLAAREQSGAIQLVFALLIDEDAAERQKQIALLKADLTDDEIAQVLALFEKTKGLDARLRLPLVDMAMPALQDLSVDQSKGFLIQIQELAAADQNISLFEFALQWVVGHRLLKEKQSQGRIAHKSFAPLKNEVGTLLSAIAQNGNPGQAGNAKEAFEFGLASISALAKKKAPIKFEASVSVGDLGRALDAMSLASFAVKRQMILAAARCAFADKKVTPEEGELLRIISIALDCPMPPFVQKLA
jgi:Zn-dependent protease with chaperone function